MTKSSQITRYAVIAAIVFLGFAIDTLLRNVFAFQIAVVSLIAVFTVAILCPLKEGFFAGIAFGVFSMIRAIVMPSAAAALTMVDFWVSFQNPIIAVLPRAFIGITARYAFKWVYKLSSKFTLSAAVGGAVGTLTNTLGVCVCMLVMKAVFVPNFGLFDFILTFFTVNCIIEIAVCAVVVPALCSGLKRSAYFKGDN